MSTLAILIARGGSKRIPRNNPRPFLSDPTIASFDLSTKPRGNLVVRFIPLSHQYDLSN